MVALRAKSAGNFSPPNTRQPAVQSIFRRRMANQPFETSAKLFLAQHYHPGQPALVELAHPFQYLLVRRGTSERFAPIQGAGQQTSTSSLYLAAKHNLTAIPARDERRRQNKERGDYRLILVNDQAGALWSYRCRRS